MANNTKHTHIAYRCPDCGVLIYGLVSEFALKTSAMRLKCDCGKSSLDITPIKDNKIKLSIPCILCKDNHSFIVPASIFFERDLFLMNCPYANMDIGFIGKQENIENAARENEKALRKIVDELELDDIGDLQPEDMDEDEVLPDASVYDLIRFVVKDLEADGSVICPCGRGSYDLRYAPGGIQVYCPDCGASHTFLCESASLAEEYLGIDKIELK